MRGDVCVDVICDGEVCGGDGEVCGCVDARGGGDGGVVRVV